MNPAPAKPKEYPHAAGFGVARVHRWLRDVIDDATMNALFNLEAKLFIDSFRIKG